jgi:hypothetical protein
MVTQILADGTLIGIIALLAAIGLDVLRERHRR